ncbi:BON domain-containing protein [Rhizobium ruizarguesonis]|nr:BON domain-containing protein [Rhizobium ruizarguesonis]
MRFGPVDYNHEERCSQGHSSASTIATIEAALSADPDIDNSAIEIRMLGPVVLLEGFINKAADRDKAISLAAMIVGWENVGPGMKTHVRAAGLRSRLLFDQAVRLTILATAMRMQAPMKPAIR